MPFTYDPRLNPMNLHVVEQGGPQYLSAGGEGWGNSGGLDFASVGSSMADYMAPHLEQLRRNQLLAQLSQGGGAPLGYQQPGVMGGGLGAAPRASASGAGLPMDTVSGEKLPQDPRVLAYLPQLMAAMNGTTGGHGYARVYGDEPNLQARQPGMGAPMARAQQGLDAGIYGTVPDQNAVPNAARAPEQRMAAAQAFAARTNLPGLQQEQLIKHGTGKTPDEWMKFTADMRQKEAEMRKAQEEVVKYHLGFTGFDKFPEHLLASAGYHDLHADTGDPVDASTPPNKIRKNVYSAYVPPENIFDPMDPTHVIGKKPGRYVEVPYGHTQAVIASQRGLPQDPVAALRAEQAALHSENQSGMPEGVPESQVQWGALGSPQSESAASLPGVAARHALGNFFSPGGGMDRRIGNAGIGAFNQAAELGLAGRNLSAPMLNYLYQLFGGNQNVMQPNAQLAWRAQPIQSNQAAGPGWNDPKWSTPFGQSPVAQPQFPATDYESEAQQYSPPTRTNPITFSQFPPAITVRGRAHPELQPPSFRAPAAPAMAESNPYIQPGYVASNRGIVRADTGDPYEALPPGFVLSNRGIVRADTGEPLEHFIQPGYVWSNRGIVSEDTGEPLSARRALPPGYVQSIRGIVNSGTGQLY